LPQPINGEIADVSSNYSIALASVPRRAYWMSDRSGEPQVWVAALGNGTVSNANLITLTLPGGCARLGADAAPWTNPDGTFLLFNAVETDPTCATGDDVSDLFYVPLGSGGLPLGNAYALDDVNTPGWDDVTPAMSTDLCRLYFASDEGPQGPEFDVYVAQRQ
jgi:hypothetical protein